jgi:Bacterial protein of unknown function (Gcw_chp)
MQRARIVGSAVLLSAVGFTIPSQAQTEVGVDLGLYSSYVWRGLSLTNKPVAQPAVYLSIPVSNASVTLGGWANIDLGSYDDINDDIAEGGGTSFNLSEFDPYAEISFPVGKATLTGGVTGYIYPNDEEAPNDFGLLTSDANTVEIYGKLGYDAPLSPELSIYYDVDKIEGAYIEGAVSYSLAASENVSIDLGALAGFSAGQDCDGDFASDTCSNSFNFADNGFTHLDLSAGVPFAAGAFSITPVLHLVINGDDATKITSPSEFDKDVKLWGGVSLSWSRALGPEPEPTDEARP